MKLLFDHNLSPRLINKLADLYPNSNHLYLLGLNEAEDLVVWVVVLQKQSKFSEETIMN